MSYQYQSFQSSLPPTITSGWNDPPNLSTTVPISSTRLVNMRRRLTGCGGYNGSMNPCSGLESPQQYAQQHISQGGIRCLSITLYFIEIAIADLVASSVSIGVPTSTPIPSQPTSANLGGSTLIMTNSSEVLAQPSQGPTHPCQSTQFLPQQQASSGNFYSLPSPAAQTQCVSLVQPEFGNQAMPSAQNEVHRPVYDAFTTSSSIAKTFDPFAIKPPNSSNPIQTHTAWTAASAPSNTQPYSVGTVTPPVLQPIEQNPQNMIFAPPNCVDDARRPFTQQDDTNYR
uniref:Uncharacterized protein n=1 Tax=Heterorhabditis bacteriophora TaxID=37862 RepID=A0A1I7X032_HETBA